MLILIQFSLLINTVLGQFYPNELLADVGSYGMSGAYGAGNFF